MLSGAKRSRNIYGCCYGLLDSSTSLRFAQNDSELIPPRPLRSRGRVLSVAVTACLSPRRGEPRPLNYSSLLSTTLKLLLTTLNFFPYKTVRGHHNGLNGHNGL